MTRCRASSVMMYLALQIQSACSARSVDAKRSRLPARNIQLLREKVLQSVGFASAARVHEDDFDVAAEFPQDLPTGPARRCEGVRISGDGDAAEGAHRSEEHTSELK